MFCNSLRRTVPVGLQSRWFQISRVACSLAMCVVVLCGCSGEEDPTLPVSGRITLNGKPLEHGDIEFGGTGGNSLRRGAMIVNGTYATAPMQGLVPGEFVVRIFSVPAGANDPVPDVMPGEEVHVPSRDMIPAEYNMRSKQKVTVTAEGPNEFNWDIVTKGSSQKGG